MNTNPHKTREATGICKLIWRHHYDGGLDPRTEPVNVLGILRDDVRRKDPTIGCPNGEVQAWSMAVVVECIDGGVRFMEVYADGKHNQYGKDWEYEIHFPGVLENRKTDHENQGSRGHLPSFLAGC